MATKRKRKRRPTKRQKAVRYTKSVNRMRRIVSTIQEALPWLEDDGVQTSLSSYLADDGIVTAVLTLRGNPTVGWPDAMLTASIHLKEMPNDIWIWAQLAGEFAAKAEESADGKPRVYKKELGLDTIYMNPHRAFKERTGTRGSPYMHVVLRQIIRKLEERPTMQLEWIDLYFWYSPRKAEQPDTGKDS